MRGGEREGRWERRERWEKALSLTHGSFGVEKIMGRKDGKGEN